MASTTGEGKLFWPGAFIAIRFKMTMQTTLEEQPGSAQEEAYAAVFSDHFVSCCIVLELFWQKSTTLQHVWSSLLEMAKAVKSRNSILATICSGGQKIIHGMSERESPAWGRVISISLFLKWRYVRFI